MSRNMCMCVKRRGFKGIAWLLVFMFGLHGCQMTGANETDKDGSVVAVGGVETAGQRDSGDLERPGDTKVTAAPAEGGVSDDDGESDGTQTGGSLSDGTAEPSAAAEAVMKGTVIQVSGTTVLLAVDGNSSSGLFTVETADIPIADASGNPAKIGAVVPGMLVDVEYDGFIEEVYPGIVANPSRVRITDSADDMTGFYLTVVRDIFETDSALNSGIRTIALDLTGVHNLSDAEKEALVYLVWTQLGYEAVQSTWDELCEEGFIDEDRLSFEEGIVITFTDTPVKGSSFDFMVKKWRSGDGSIGYDDCKAKKSGKNWEYTLGGAWIS